MKNQDDLHEFFEEGIEALRLVIEHGHGDVPVLDPLTSLPTLSGAWKFGKARWPHGDLSLSIADPEVTGLKTVALTGDPSIVLKTKTLRFSLTLDQLRLTSPRFEIEGDLQLLFKERRVAFNRRLSVKLKKIRLDFVFSIDVTDGEPTIRAQGTKCSYDSVRVDVGQWVLNLILHWFKGRISPWVKDRIADLLSEKLGTALGGILTKNVRQAYSAQKPMIDKLVSLYEMKLNQGGWPDGEGPRVLEGFGGVGELPLPMLWDLPAVDVDNLEHHNVQQIMENCRTGDVILFSGTAKSSQRIRRFTQSPFSHVVVLIKEPELADGRALIWQATSSTHNGVLRDMQALPGIQLNFLDEMVRDYRSEATGANVVYRKLIRAERSVEEEEPARQKVIEFIREMDSKPYTDDMDGLYVMGLLEVDDSKEDDFFCAGLVAETLMRFSVLTDAFLQYQYAPRDFCDLQQCLPFEGSSVSFSAEIVMDPESA